MDRLDFSFYRGLYADLEMYETRFAQLQRDYARELRGETLFFAVDFSELHSYIHPASEDAHRAAINTYILNTLDDRFSMLPGATGELLSDLERTVPRHLKPDFGKALYTHPSVAKFLSGFPAGIQDEKRLAKSYAKAEAELRSALGGILDVLVLGHSHTSILALKDLLDKGKLTPIRGIQQIGQFSPESRRLAQLVESFLSVDRPGVPENNQIDAVDFLFALLLNQQGDPSDRRYITIYSQATSLIRACRSHDSLRWDNDYLIREAKYLQLRTKLQEMFGSARERHDYVVEGHKLCQQLKTGISRIVDIDEQFQEGAASPTLELVDLHRRFDEEYRQPLLFRGEAGEELVTGEQARRLYEILRDEQRFAGEAEEAYEVLKEHLRNIHRTLQAFAPALADTADIKAYKENLRRWLGFDVSATSEPECAELAEEG